jgi:hypothetical protein
MAGVLAFQPLAGVPEFHHVSAETWRNVMKRLPFERNPRTISGLKTRRPRCGRCRRVGRAAYLPAAARMASVLADSATVTVQ